MTGANPGPAKTVRVLLRRGAAAAARVGNARFGKGFDVSGHIGGGQGKAGHAAFQHGHARVRLDDEGLVRDGGHLFCRLQQLVRPDGAVGADHIGAHGVQQDRRGGRIGPRDGAAVFGVGHLTDDGKGACRFRRGEGGPHFLNVDDRLDDEAVRAGVGEGFGEAVKAAGRFVEGKTAEGADELARGADVPGDLDAGGSVAGIGDRRFRDGFHFIFQAVVGEFQRRRAEGVRRDEFASRAVKKMHDIPP